MPIGIQKPCRIESIKQIGGGFEITFTKTDEDDPEQISITFTSNSITVFIPEKHFRKESG